MGGRETIFITLQKPELFGYVCAMSAAPGIVATTDKFMTHPGQLQESEVKAVRWASREEIARMTREGTFIPYHPGLIDLLFLHNTHSSIYDWK